MNTIKESDQADAVNKQTDIRHMLAGVHPDNCGVLDLSQQGLTALSDAVCSLSNLQDLNIAGNRLGSLPSGIGQLSSLRFLNAMNNQLVSLPAELCELTALYRLGLKGNHLQELPSGFGNLTGLVELFLTNNRLQSLPDSIGHCSSLVKLQASRNKLACLPASLGQLPKLELLRVAVNDLHSLPATLFLAPCLAWVSIAGNPVCPPASAPTHAIPDINSSDLALGPKLGDGASGEVVQAEWRGERFALKQFAFDLDSPDGQASDEIAVQLVLDHPALTRVVAHLRGHEPPALLLDLVQGQPMAAKPNFEFLLRCRWPEGATYSLAWVLAASKDVADALAHMHSKHIAHGDVYAHNMLAMAGSGRTVLCDYGAAFFYPAEQSPLWQALEVRAFGLFLSDLLQRLAPADVKASKITVASVQALCEQAFHAKPSERPSFADIAARLSKYQADLAQ